MDRQFRLEPAVVDVAKMLERWSFLFQLLSKFAILFLQNLDDVVQLSERVLSVSDVLLVLLFEVHVYFSGNPCGLVPTPHVAVPPQRNSLVLSRFAQDLVGELGIEPNTSGL
jgi:hypothetical protein